MITAPLVALVAALAFGADSAPVSSGPVGAPSVSALKERFLGATEEPERAKLLDQIAATTPSSGQDVASLFDLFSRYPDAGLRRKVMESLGRLRPDAPQLEPIFVTYLQQVEPETQLFGINGAFRLRSRQGLPFVRKIAERKFAAPSPASANALSERNQWWTQYEALSALAQWEGEKTIPLLRSKSVESPGVARLLGQFFWKKDFADLKAWALSDKPSERSRAAEYAAAMIEPADARATRDDMLALVRDAKADDEVRHQLALKVGACSADAEVDALIAEHDKAADDKTRLLWAAAVFASHSPRSVPLLTRYARESPDEATRAGARVLMVDQLGEDAVKALLENKKDFKK